MQYRVVFTIDECLTMGHECIYFFSRKNGPVAIQDQIHVALNSKISWTFGFKENVVYVYFEKTSSHNLIAHKRKIHTFAISVSPSESVYPFSHLTWFIHFSCWFRYDQCLIFAQPLSLSETAPPYIFLTSYIDLWMTHFASSSIFLS